METERLPYYCDDCDTWHATLFSYDLTNGTPIEGDQDGNWDAIEIEDYPDATDFADAWECYFKWCALRGEDPLDELMLETRTPKKVQWQIKVRDSVAGLVLSWVRRRGRGPRLHLENIPKYVREYMGVNKGRFITGWEEDTVATVKPQWTEVTWQRSGSDSVGLGILRIEEPLPEKDFSVEIKRAARHHLKVYSARVTHDVQPTKRTL